MNKLTKFITPLFLLAILSLLYGLWRRFISDEHWADIEGYIVLLFVSFPTTIAYALLILFVKNHKARIIIDTLIVFAIIGAFYYRFNRAA